MADGRTAQGTPQGAVISPLLTNLYLHLVDRHFRLRAQRGELHGRLVRYADDFDLLSPHRPDLTLGPFGEDVAPLTGAMPPAVRSAHEW